jgi:DNA adenine methylase
LETFLRWAGSKKQIIPRLAQFWNESFGRYIEPFAGSASLFFHVRPERAILGDLNADLITSLRAIQLDVSRVIECLRRLRKGKEAYYELRAIDPNTLSDVERAARFVHLNFFCFNGLYRTNLKGQFNVPFGDKKGRDSVDEEKLVAAAAELRKATLMAGDFEHTIKHAGRGDFVYLDPPYVTREGEGFSEYLPGSFAVADLERLTAALDRLHRRGATFVLSYLDSSHARELFEPWQRHSVWVRRNIAGFSGHRRGVSELLATNIGLAANGH